jgi:hypothetical protein
MSLSEGDRAAVERVRRSQKVIPVFLLLMWLIGSGVLVYRVSVILDVTRPHGVESVSELLSLLSSIETDKEQFSRFEMLLVREERAVTTGFLFMFIVTVFCASLIPMGRLVDRLAAAADHPKANVDNPPQARSPSSA